MRSFEKGVFLCEYSGNLIDLRTALSLEQSYPKRMGSYLYYFEHNSHRYWLVSKVFELILCFYSSSLDSTKESDRYGRLINHSKLSPNVVPKIFILDGQPRVVFMAKQKILVGQELLYDYGDRLVVEVYDWLYVICSIFRRKDSLKIFKWLRE